MSILNIVKAVVAGAAIAVAVTVTARYLGARAAAKGVEATFGDVSKEDAAKVAELSKIQLPAGNVGLEAAMAYVEAKMAIVKTMDNLELAKCERATVCGDLFLKNAANQISIEVMLHVSEVVTTTALKGEVK